MPASSLQEWNRGEDLGECRRQGARTPQVLRKGVCPAQCLSLSLTLEGGKRAGVQAELLP